MGQGLWCVQGSKAAIRQLRSALEHTHDTHTLSRAVAVPRMWKRAGRNGGGAERPRDIMASRAWRLWDPRRRHVPISDLYTSGITAAIRYPLVTRQNRPLIKDSE